MSMFIDAGSDGYGSDAEKRVFEAVKSAFAKRDAIGYREYTLFVRQGNVRKKPDILVADQYLGIIIIEVKGFKLEDIYDTNGPVWICSNGYKETINPYEQAENQLFALLEQCEAEPILKDAICGRVLVSLPYINSDDWLNKGFFSLATPPIIFEDNLRPKSLFHTICDAELSHAGRALSDEQWEALKSMIGVGGHIREPSKERPAESRKSRARVVAESREAILGMDVQQERISKQIPPGLQRVRGIAGSGKTVLLVQRAAHMHLEHPDWDIAFVFYTRSLYDTIIRHLDKTLRRFTNGEVGYESTNQKLRVLHAWGSTKQEGFYSLVAKAHEIKPKAVKDIPENIAFHDKFAWVIQDFFATLQEQSKVLKPLFNALVIDEGQDLVANLKLEDKQAFYWLAYQSLKPSSETESHLRRLTWAYDEAQSLDNLKVPVNKELFGEELSGLLSRGSKYKGGASKSEVMQVCYRTPAPILSAAHALGMGLLRKEGMVTGITTAKEWKDIGYEVSGSFRAGQEVTVHRPEKNAPNVIPKFWEKPVFHFETFRTRATEAQVVAQRIAKEIEQEKLEPSRDIIIILLGNHFEMTSQLQVVAGALREQNINYYLPTMPRENILKVDHFSLEERNKFWHDGAVTLTGVARAKGNEAEVAYVLGLDYIAHRESDPKARNQLFTAMTRARGWLHLSGVGRNPFYDEVKRVYDAKGSYTFAFKRPARVIDENE